MNLNPNGAPNHNPNQSNYIPNITPKYFSKRNGKPERARKTETEKDGKWSYLGPKPKPKPKPKTS